MDFTTELTNAAMWAMVVGFIQPFVLQFLLQSKWSSAKQSIVALAFSVVTGGLTAYFAGAFVGLEIVSIILLVAVTSISSYKGFWKDTTGQLKSATSADKTGEPSIEKTDTAEVVIAVVDANDGPKHLAD